MSEPSQSRAIEVASLWQRRFEDAIDMCTSLLWQEDRNCFFQGIAKHLYEMTGADNVNIRLLSSSQDAFVTYVTNGDIDLTLLGEYSVLSATDGRMPELMRTHRPIVFEFAQPQSDDIKWERGVRDGFHTCITVPLVNAERVEGVCDLLYRSENNVDEQTLGWLVSLGRLIGTIISNSLLVEAQIDMRLADERRRLGSEIHDNLAQAMTYISFESGNMQQSLEEGDKELLANQIMRLSKASNQAARLLRGEMAQLHDQKANEVLSIGSIREYLDNFARQWGLSLQVDFESQHDDVSIPSRIAMQLMRILNEAMINIVRHSSASAVQVVIVEEGDSLALRVIDDGCGFDVESVSSDSLGIRTMRERAHLVNGDVLVISKPGEGTQVNIFIPHIAQRLS